MGKLFSSLLSLDLKKEKERQRFANSLCSGQARRKEIKLVKLNYEGNHLVTKYFDQVDKEREYFQVKDSLLPHKK